MRQNRIDALRRLSERPGTEAEGIVAREMLKRAEAKQSPEESTIGRFRTFLHTGSMEDLAQAVGPRRCDCGSSYAAFSSCQNELEHLRIQTEIRTRFAKGVRVFYNRWAYSENCPGTVTGYAKLTPGIPQWAWLSVKFDHLRSARRVPVYSALGWHLTHGPVDKKTLRQTGIRGGMERIDSVVEALS